MLQAGSANPASHAGELKIWKVRAIKNYPEAHNHILVGRVLEVTESYVRLHCRSYHFGPVLNSPEDVLIGDVMVRVIPWSRIEVINELPQSFDYIHSTVISDKPGQVLFKDREHFCSIGRGAEPSY